jgi:hypothetical protein
MFYLYLTEEQVFKLTHFNGWAKRRELYRTVQEWCDERGVEIAEVPPEQSEEVLASLGIEEPDTGETAFADQLARINGTKVKHPITYVIPFPDEDMAAMFKMKFLHVYLH